MASDHHLQLESDTKDVRTHLFEDLFVDVTEIPSERSDSKNRSRGNNICEIFDSEIRSRGNNISERSDSANGSRGKNVSERSDCTKNWSCENNLSERSDLENRSRGSRYSAVSESYGEDSQWAADKRGRTSVSRHRRHAIRWKRGEQIGVGSFGKVSEQRGERDFDF